MAQKPKLATVNRTKRGTFAKAGTPNTVAEPLLRDEQGRFLPRSALSEFAHSLAQTNQGRRVVDQPSSRRFSFLNQPGQARATDLSSTRAIANSIKQSNQATGLVFHTLAQQNITNQEIMEETKASVESVAPYIKDTEKYTRIGTETLNKILDEVRSERRALTVIPFKLDEIHEKNNQCCKCNEKGEGEGGAGVGGIAAILGGFLGWKLLKRFFGGGGPKTPPIRPRMPGAAPNETSRENAPTTEELNFTSKPNNVTPETTTPRIAENMTFTPENVFTNNKASVGGGTTNIPSGGGGGKGPPIEPPKGPSGFPEPPISGNSLVNVSKNLIKSVVGKTIIQTVSKVAGITAGQIIGRMFGVAGLILNPNATVTQAEENKVMGRPANAGPFGGVPATSSEPAKKTESYIPPTVNHAAYGPAITPVINPGTFSPPGAVTSLGPPTGGAKSTTTPISGAGGALGSLISSGEGDYGSFNRGTAGDAHGAKLDFSKMSLADIMAQQAQGKLFAVGKYQMIPSTMRDAVTKLGLDPKTTNFTPEVQEQMFRNYLVDQKRPEVKAYITGQSEDLTNAASGLAKEFASVADPATGRSRYGGVGGNASSISPQQTQATLLAERQQYQKNLASGMKPDEAWRALSANPSKGNMAIGDSIAVGIGQAGKMTTMARVGAHPQEILNNIQNADPATIKDKDITLSSGASNNPSQVALVEQQIKALQEKGAKSVKLLGVGDRQDFTGVNEKLNDIAQKTGATFGGALDPNNLSADRVHPRNYNLLASSASLQTPPQSSTGQAVEQATNIKSRLQDASSTSSTVPVVSAPVTVSPVMDDTNKTGGGMPNVRPDDPVLLRAMLGDIKVA